VTKATPKKKAAFLAALAAGDSVTSAAVAAGVVRQHVYKWRESDEAFAADWDAAIEAGTDRLEDAARDRALKASDTLLIFLLKGRRPEKFKDKADVNVSGAVEHTHKVVRVPAKVKKEEWPELLPSR
jgi:hypothetical protein